LKIVVAGMAEFAAMPLWTDAYLGDTTHLTTIEHGAYLLLLMTAWRSKDGRLPDDDRLLARYTGLTTGQWARIRPVLIPFFDIKDGFITQGRLIDERAAVKRNSKRASDNAKARWLKTKDTGDADALPVAPSRDAPLPLPLPLPDDLPEGKPSTPRATKPKPQRDEHPDFESWFTKYPHKVAKKEAAEAFRRAMSEATIDDLMAGLDRYIASKPPDRAWCNPATWLNKARWLDRPQEVQNGNRNTTNNFKPNSPHANLFAGFGVTDLE
jgi:uncharacterized protein YdaU (DUF1376 family)